MPTITLKNIPEELYRRIKATAVQHRRSVNSEVIFSLEQCFLAQRRSPEEILAEVDALRGRLKLPPLTDKEIDDAKRVGRP